MTVQSYVKFTETLLSNVSSPCLLLAPEASLNMYVYTEHNCYKYADVYYARTCNKALKVIVPTIDFFDFFSKYKQDASNKLFESCIALRVFEHIPVRNIDWFLYQLASVMKASAELHIVVPDMAAVAMELINVSKQLRTNPDYFRFLRLNYELLSEGDHVYDRHSTWTDENSIVYLLEMENLFHVDKIEKVRLDTDIVPSELYVIATRT